jgi:4-hydroxy-tetrahydrodipicolinate reductase
MLRVAVAGAAGRMGQVTCAAIEAADDLELVARAGAGDVPEAVFEADVLVDFTRPDAVLGNVKAALDAETHVVVGTTGYDEAALRAAADGVEANVFAAPNFAIGAVLMMRFAAEAARFMDAAEIVEVHPPAKRDRPSGTAKRTAQLMKPALRDVPIHSLRLPGVVADQEVVLGAVAQTLSIRHSTTDRTSFMPGVLLAIRRVPELPESPTVGLERLLWP